MLATVEKGCWTGWGRRAIDKGGKSGVRSAVLHLWLTGKLPIAVFGER